MTAHACHSEGTHQRVIDLAKSGGFLPFLSGSSFYQRLKRPSMPTEALVTYAPGVGSSPKGRLTFTGPFPPITWKPALDAQHVEIGVVAVGGRPKASPCVIHD
jgi:hypothetical protein